MKTGLLNPLCLIILKPLCQTSLAVSHYEDSSWSGARLGGHFCARDPSWVSTPLVKCVPHCQCLPAPLKDSDLQFME